MAYNLNKFLTQHKNTQSQSLKPADLKYIAETFDETYAAFLEKEGFAGYDDGLFWTVDPREYDAVLKEFKLNPSVFKVIVRSAFGDLIFTNGVGMYFFYTAHNEQYQFSSSIDNLFNLFLCTSKFLRKEMRGDDFKKISSRLGALSSDECYGYVPALSQGGIDDITNLQKMKIREYLSILAQSQN